jgi:hypothetical protein
MPMEGQWQRAGTPLAARDRRVLAVVVSAALVGVLAALLLGHAFGSGRANADCVSVNLGSTMGGIGTQNCGARARSFCGSQGRLDATVEAQCRRLGYPLPQP